MNEVLLTNIFFVITGIAIIICAALVCIALFYVIKAVRTLRRILDTIEAGAEVIAEDMQQIRAFFTQEGLVGRMVSLLAGRKRRTHRRAHRDAEDRGN
jgi:hypothetical protein